MHSYLTPGVKKLIGINIACFLLQLIGSYLSSSGAFVLDTFALSYWGIVNKFYAWTPFTYMFLHGSFLHLLFNMLALFFFGCEIEREWGSARFVRFYLLSGLGAGIIIFFSEALGAIISGSAPYNFTVGASGAIFGILLVYSLIYSERQLTILLFFVIPVTLKAKYLIVVLLGITLLFSAFFAQNISHIGHIGGVLSAMCLLFAYRKRAPFSYPYNKLKSWLSLPFKQQHRNFRSLSTYERTAKNKFSFRTFMRSGRVRKADLSLDETSMNEHEIEEKIDELLDVISKRGLKSLSANEKKFLNRVSLLYRHKFPN